MKYSYLPVFVVALVGLWLSTPVSSFSTAPAAPASASIRSATTTTTTRLHVHVDISSISSAQEAAALLQTGASSFATILRDAESPADVWNQVPLAAQGVAVAAGLVGLQVWPTVRGLVRSVQQVGKNKRTAAEDAKANAKKKNPKRRSDIVTYAEGQPATYELNDNVVPFEFADAALVRPLLKQTQLETRPLQLVYDANRDGYDAQTFHNQVDAKGAAVVLAKVGGKWCGGYNPRGWASLGQARSSVAAFLYYQTGGPLPFGGGGWQKIRVSRTGSMACGKDLYDDGIWFGADSLVIPLRKPNPRKVSSRLGQYFEPTPEGKLTILPKPVLEYDLQELKVLTGVYAEGEGLFIYSTCLFYYAL